MRVLESGRLCVIPLDRSLYARTREDLGDLRLTKDDEEIPFLIEFQNRLIVVVRWAFQYLTFSRGARLITGSDHDKPHG